ncbi:MAG TPA: tRNA preQ1(34) S-adenosylmethionine ribosyltransferase-isomerase QueA [Thermoanaerobaculia bacterium]|jgi:S-adenosylmethionine:tRNA ribosyltransferase-isomerase|nr:tRNA preQ1(34) S-adenosylmethionine ribosyltransferase-isomerase QueA [Thermoanaerobaculia bacterium]
MRVDLFDYDLPADRIAQQARPRGTSRLLVLGRSTSSIEHHRFVELPELLRAGDLLVRNDVRVRPARLFGRDREDRVVELFLLAREDASGALWRCLAKPGRRAKTGFSARLEEGLSARVEEVRADGTRVVRFDRPLDAAILERIGRTPLPPYIRREPGAPDRAEDREAYQTVFAREPLAVAAPTAGLHFTPEIIADLDRRGVEIADLTLAVGPGTFKPVTADDTEAHELGAEEVAVPAATRAAVARARAEGRRVVAVGTTVTRSLEALARRNDPDGEDVRFGTDLFITPGFEFRAIDALLTNFHLPRSTLLMLVSAFVGRERALAAYEEAKREGYLFYSFGDAMLIA